MPECEQTLLDQTSVEYLPNWLNFAVPFSEEEPAKCARYQLSGAQHDGEGQEQNQCSQETFNRSVEIKCNEFVYKNDEVTILNEVGDDKNLRVVKQTIYIYFEFNVFGLVVCLDISLM